MISWRLGAVCGNLGNTTNNTNTTTTTNNNSNNNSNNNNSNNNSSNNNTTTNNNNTTTTNNNNKKRYHPLRLTLEFQPKFYHPIPTSLEIYDIWFFPGTLTHTHMRWPCLKIPPYIGGGGSIPIKLQSWYFSDPILLGSRFFSDMDG